MYPFTRATFQYSDVLILSIEVHCIRYEERSASRFRSLDGANGRVGRLAVKLRLDLSHIPECVGRHLPPFG